MEIPSSLLDRLQDLYDRALYVQAWRLAEPHGHPRTWRGTRARVLGGRILGNLGARRAACALHFATWRADRADAEAAYYAAYAVQERRGAWEAWRFLKSAGDFPGASERLKADLELQRAEVAGGLRDFDAAEALLGRAEAGGHDPVWAAVIRARILEMEDRYAEAEAPLRRALELRPLYRPAVQQLAHLLQLLDRDADALALLRAAAAVMESGPVCSQLAALETELGLHAEARETVERVAALSPLVEKDLAKWLAARRSEAAFLCGDVEAAAARAAEADTPFYRRLAERLKTIDPAAKRVQLDVGFVRQHHMTCAPATLTALSRFWGKSAEHLAVAERICYDGTPAPSERRWAEENGWAVREFTITKEAATSLLDRGIPFTLTTVDPGNAHLQAMIGYDGRRGTFILRDPYERNWGEADQEEFLKHYRSSGPRGMAMAPPDRADALRSLDLPEAGLYDRFYDLHRALDRHERPAAEAAAAALAARAPGHRLSLMAKRALAAYDADRAGMLAATEELLNLYPEDLNLEISRLGLLRELSRREDRLAALERLSEGPKAHPMFRPLYAQELAADARHAPRAVALLRETLRLTPRDASSLRALADLLWNRLERDEALELYRFAACIEDKNEDLAAAYFIACRHLRQTAGAVLFLRNRVRRFGKASGWPVRTLFWALDQLDRTPEAFEALEEALRARPDDGELLLYAADARSRTGDFARAAELLAAAEGKARPALYLRTAAQLAIYRGDRAESLSLWRRVLAAEPLAMDAHASVALLAGETEGRDAAFEHLRSACREFPHHQALHQLRIEWLREGDPGEQEAALRHLLAVNPADAWAHREISLLLGRSGRLDEALAEAEEGARLDPATPIAGWCRALALARLGRREEAVEACRASVRIAVDYEPAVHELVSLSVSGAERREALAFIHAELARQVVFGDGLVAFRGLAKGTLEPEELLARLREGLEARPDLWHAGSAVLHQLAEMNRLDEAVDLAKRWAERFPLVPRAWLDLAYVQQLRGEDEIGSLEQALRINPAWGPASRELASAYERRSDYAKSRAVLERAVARSPLEAANHGGLAWTLWRLGEREAAVSRLERAVRLEPGYEWAWGTLSEWSKELGRPELPEKLALDLTERRAGEARSWLILARILRAREDVDGALRALEQACARDARWAEPRDVKAEALAAAGRFEEALAACGWIPPGERQPPLELRGRAAWVDARRGHLPRAIERMRAIVKEEPGYSWGWMQLADWCRDTADRKGALEAARNVARLAPQSAVAFAYLGEARWKDGDETGAKADFARAFELAPDHLFAGYSLFDLQLKAGGVDDAAKTLEKLRVHAEGPFLLARVAQLAGKKGDLDGALGALAALCRLPGQDRWPYDTALAAAREAGGATRAEAVLEAELRKAGTNPLAAWVWVGALASRKAWADAERSLAAIGPAVWPAAAAALVEALAEARAARQVRGFVARNAERLKADVDAWGSVGYALHRIGKAKAAAEWMEGGDRRAGAKPWMLLNRTVALHACGRFEDATRAAREGLKRTPDHTYGWLRVWAGLGAAVDGDAREAKAAVEEVDPQPLTPYYRGLRTLIESVVGAREGDFVAARNRFDAAFATVPFIERDLAFKRCWRRVARCIARLQGGWRGRCWRWWNLLIRQ
jgi:tetratricopeptide (TPR) repeat protein